MAKKTRRTFTLHGKTVTLTVWAFVLFIVAATSAGHGGQTKGAAVVRDGKAKAVVVTDGTFHVNRAVDGMVDYVKRSTGATLDVVTQDVYERDPAAHADKTAVYVGAIPAAYAHDVKRGLDGLDDQGFVIYPRGETVIIAGPSLWGTLHGVNEFLERYVGVRWLMIGPVGEDVPKRADVVVPYEDVREEPAFRYRVLWNPFNGNDPYISFGGSQNVQENMWAHRNKTQGRYNYGIRFGHNMHSIFPPERYGKSNPEFYPGGKPPAPGERMRWQPCFSNPETIDVAVDHIIDYFHKNPDAINFMLSVNDSGGFCEADPSHPEYTGKLNTSGYPDMSDLYYRWINDVVERVLEVHPDKWFSLSAYREVTDPPSFPLHPRVLPRITKDRMTWLDDDIRANDYERMAKWSEVAEQVAWYDYMYGFLYYVPRVYHRWMGELFRYAHEHDVVGWTIENQYHASDGPKAWLLARLMWDPYQDVDALLDEWYERAVGPEAAPHLKRFYDGWERFWTEFIPQTDWFQFRKNVTYLQFTDPSYLEYVTPEDMADYRRLLETVVDKTGTQEQRARAELLLEAFEFQEASVLSYPRTLESPAGVEEAQTFVDDVLRALGEGVAEAERRYDDHDAFQYHRDRNMRVRNPARSSFFQYWWTDWTGWKHLYVKQIVEYLTAYEPGGGPVTDRVRSFFTSDDATERALAYFVAMTRGDQRNVPTLIENGSFEDGATGWTTHVDGRGTIEVHTTEPYSGARSLNFRILQRGRAEQTFDASAGLFGASLRYYTPIYTQRGTIEMTVEGLDAEGEVVASVSTEKRFLGEHAGQWATLSLTDVLSRGLFRRDIVEGRIIIAVSDTLNARVYVDDVVVTQRFPKDAPWTWTRPDRLANVALGKPVKASSTSLGTRPENAVDGDRSVRWHTDKILSGPHWLEVDLKDTFTLSEAVLWSGSFNNRDGRWSVPHMQLQYWDGNAWKNIPEASVRNNRSHRVQMRFQREIVTNKIRLYTESNRSPDGEGLLFRELEVYGEPVDRSL